MESTCAYHTRQKPIHLLFSARHHLPEHPCAHMRSWWPVPAVNSISSSGSAAEKEGTPNQPTSKKEPEIPALKEESEKEDEVDNEETDNKEDE